MSRSKTPRNLALAALLAMGAGTAGAEPPASPPESTPSSEADIRAALFGGVPGDRWKEGPSARAGTSR